jgi:DNA-binding NarL/FixJ family response regulator
VTGRPFASLLRDLVFDPLGMAHSGYETDFPARHGGATASGHDAGGLPIAGNWRVLPESAGAGLWTTPADLCRLEVEVAGRFIDADSAMAALDEDSADLLVVDVDVGGTSDGIGLVRLARTRRPTIRIVVLTLDDSPARVHSALTAGADAYVLKAAHPDDLATAVRQSFTHSMYLAAPPAGLSHETTPLTACEVEILRLVAEGYSNRRLAEILSVSEPTVKFHLTNVYRKLGVGNRTEASRWAQRHGLLAATTRRD